MPLDPTLFREALQVLLRQVESALAQGEPVLKTIREQYEAAQAQQAALISKRDQVRLALGELLSADDATVDNFNERRARVPLIDPLAPRRVRNMLIGHPTPTVSLSGNQTAEPTTQAATLEVRPVPSRRVWRADVERRIEGLLRGGNRLATQAIFSELLAQGVDFQGILNPTHRLVQILSGAKNIKADRVHGWGLSSLELEADTLSATADIPPEPQTKTEDDDEL